MSREIVRYWADNGEWLLAYHYPGSSLLPMQEPAKLSECPTEELVELMEQDCESDNYHMFVGVHRNLALLLEQHCGEWVARDVMAEIAHRGGLRAMRGS